MCTDCTWVPAHHLFSNSFLAHRVMKHLYSLQPLLKKGGLALGSCRIFIFFLLLSPLILTAQPPDFIDQQFTGPFNSAVGMTFDANSRMYVWERRGQVWIVENGVKASQPLLDISEEVGNWRDFGLLGVALDPNFLSNGYIYLLYIVDRHHLLYFGTPNYNPNTDEYFNATIGRITRYRAEASTNFTTIDYSSRKILLGESISTGFPNLHESHGTGHLVFGTDGTLLASFGDGASYSSRDEGSAGETYWQQAITDGIIPASHNVGAYRSQLLNSLAGKIVRLDPETGDGIYNNPYYDAANPRSARSRVWGRGLRNPCRFSLKPGTGSHDIDDADPGTFYIGDVGWASREEMSVCDGPAMNFGWPKFEGMTHQPGYNNATYEPSTHDQPKLDWRNGNARGIVNGAIVNIGSAQLPGPSFTGNCSIGGIWYTGTDFPEEYQNTYFHADYGGDWIRNFGFNGQDEPTISRSFKQSVDRPIYIATDPNQGGLYYLTVGGNNYVRQFSYSPGNLSPKAVASSNIQSGTSPLTIQFVGSNSYDPDQDNLSYAWDFGDGNTSNQANPIHTYTQGNGNPIQYNVKLTVSDGNLSDEVTLIISINNSPPQILSTSLDNLTTFSHTNPTTLNLSASVNDAESSNSQLSFSWVTSLYHNDHSHDEPPITNPNGSAVLSPIGCDGTTYWYRVWLTVTDPQGLSTTVYRDLFPDCGGNSQTLSFASISDKLTTDPTFTLNPSASSGLPVTLFLVSGPASISGNSVTLTGQPGEVTIRAAQGGNGTYAPAKAIDRSFQVRYPSQGGNCSYQLIQSDNFESSFGNWNDGGTDATRLNDGTYANSGSYSIMLRDNTSSSLITTNSLNLSGYSELRVDFSYIVNSFDNANEDFWLQVSTNGGASFTTVEEWNLGDEFQNLQRNNESVVIPGPFSGNTQLRFRCDASADGDQVYIDDVVINGCVGSPNDPPIASFSTSPSSGPAPLQVTVNAGASSDPNGDPLSYAWDFGNGQTASGQNASVSYANPGTYTITLYVNDGQLTDQTTQTVEVTLPGGCATPQNLALGQSASQSSTYGVGVAGLAVDGNTSGSSPWSADLQHTQNQSQPWWQVDLGQLSQIDALSIYNRTDALQDRLKDFYILISSTPMSANTPLSTLLADGSITQIFYPGSAGASVSFTPDVEGRYVRIQLSGNGILHMAEVEITGCSSGNDPCNGAQPVVINPAGPFAENAGLQTLSATPGGGTWGGAAASNGTFDPSVGPGTYTVTYTYTNGNGCTQSDVEDITVNPVGGCATLTNLALGKPSSQSSTYGVGEARYANDGNTNGTSPWTADLQHTQSEANPWWEVNLGSVQQIDQIDIYNRSNGNQNRLNNFYILVSATPMTGAASLSELLNNPSIQQIHFPGIAGAQETFATNIQGQYIRVQLGGNGILHMAEVEVKGCSQGTDPCASNGVTNLALNRPAEQSSVYGFGLASIGVDGDTDGTRGPWGNASIIHTQREAQPWWQVELLNPSDINEVIVHNRTDCCQIRLKDFYVMVSDQPFPSGVSLNSLLNDPNISNTYFPGTAGNLEQINMEASGKYLRIQLTSGNEILHIAEVEVMGCPAGTQGARFSQVQVGFQEADFTPQLFIYPNPAKSELHIEVENIAQGLMLEYSLYSPTGQRIWSKQAGRKLSTSIRDLPQGMYLLRIQGEGWTGTKQLMVH